MGFSFTSLAVASRNECDFPVQPHISRMGQSQASRFHAYGALIADNVGDPLSVPASVKRHNAILVSHKRAVISLSSLSLLSTREQKP